MFDCFTFAKLGTLLKQKIFYFFTTKNLCAVAADLLYKSVSGLCLTISRAAKAGPKQHFVSMCILLSLCF